MNKLILFLLLILVSSCNIISSLTGEESGIKGNFLGEKHYEPRPFYVVASCELNIAANYELCIYHSQHGKVNEIEINGSTGSYPNEFFAYGDYVYFRADDGIVGSELWVYNVRTNEASLVQDLYTGSPTNSSAPKSFTLVNGQLYFFIDNGTTASVCKIASPGSTPTCNAMTNEIYTDVNNVRSASDGLYFCNGFDNSYLYSVIENGTTALIGSGTSCVNGLFTDGTNFYTPDFGSNVLRIRLSDNNVSTFFTVSGAPYIYGISNGHLYVEDTGALWSVDVSNGVGNQFLGYTNPTGNRKVLGHSGNNYFTVYDGSMDQVAMANLDETAFQFVTNFTSTQNSLLQVDSIRDFHIVENQVVASVEAPNPTTAIWVVNLKSGESYSLTESTVNPSANFAVVLD